MDEFGVLLNNIIGFKPRSRTPLANLKPKRKFTNNDSSFLDSSSLPVEQLDDIFVTPVRVNDRKVPAHCLLDDYDDVFSQCLRVDLNSNSNLEDSLGINEKKGNDGLVRDDVFGIFGPSSSSVEHEEKGVEFDDWFKKFEIQSEKNTPDLNVEEVQNLNVDDDKQKHENTPISVDQRSAETMDYDIKSWAAGKEGNLRALLSSLHQVLWPECGWHPVSLADLITSDAVNKVYRKATLYVHPDKVQQKDLQQKYIAEKVFHLLQDARNKFRAEEHQ